MGFHNAVYVIENWKELKTLKLKYILGMCLTGNGMHVLVQPNLQNKESTCIRVFKSQKRRANLFFFLNLIVGSLFPAEIQGQNIFQIK